MTYRITIDLDNDAFQPDPGPEVARILRGLANAAENGAPYGPVKDINGNTVGKVESID